LNQRGVASTGTAIGIADQGSFHGGNINPCTDTIAASEHQSLDNELDLPGCQIHSSHTCSCGPRKEAAGDGAGSRAHDIFCLDDPDNLSPSDDGICTRCSNHSLIKIETLELLAICRDRVDDYKLCCRRCGLDRPSCLFPFLQGDSAPLGTSRYSTVCFAV
jgi:hypothetical protein